jgi:Arc/MetJ-type ribon-helix-helix transcriptional regulator
MTVHIKPELEEIITADLKSGGYESIDDYLEDAIELLHEKEEWLARDRAEVAAQIERGLAQAERGEFVSPNEVRVMLREMRNAETKPE